MAVAKGTQNKKIAAVEAEAVLASVKDLDLTKVVGDISTLQVQVQNTLAGLSATLTNKVQKMQDVDTAIGLKENRLSELFQIESEAVKIDDLKAQKMEEENEWEERRLERDATWAEQESDRQKAWKRAEEEHDYSLAQAKKRAQEEFEAEILRNKRSEQNRVEELNKQWATREEEIKSKETEINQLKSDVAGFDARLKTEIAKSEAIVGATLKRQFEHESALLKKDAESERALNQVKIQAMNSTIESLEAQITSLQTQLASARADAKEVATQALNSASERQVSVALQKVMDTQSQNPKANK